MISLHKWCEPCQLLSCQLLSLPPMLYSPPQWPPSYSLDIPAHAHCRLSALAAPLCGILCLRIFTRLSPSEHLVSADPSLLQNGFPWASKEARQPCYSSTSFYILLVFFTIWNTLFHLLFICILPVFLYKDISFMETQILTALFNAQSPVPTMAYSNCSQVSPLLMTLYLFSS